MAGFFGGGGGGGAVPEAPPAPTINDAEIAGQRERDALRKRRGMAATILAGTQQANQPTTQTSQLLGS